jgi:hypothetical protein
MVEAYIIEEISNFCSIYFANSVCTRRNQISRHDDREIAPPKARASIIMHSGRAIGKSTYRQLEDREYYAAHLYVLLNCPEVQIYIEYDFFIFKFLFLLYFDIYNMFLSQLDFFL